ncbi:THUMP-like domain-containing protein [Gelidibacter maritimus]|uniref:Class I SAM-dependent methyltransferase n=1 Tax=Gelidibacter maritimus TaxID=2761487 RepID=A0A7W2R4S0_9FLAO|nr:class I SAM-dependent methyltransferase [Gelidibacter maritimus]MBA6154196.1 class I SAM-dependent methyltransferase [Gelidibacter maritimus]
MNSAILNTDVQDYINQNLKTDPATLILKGVPFNEVNAAETVEQIEAKVRCEKKLPTWFHQSNIYYPNKLNIEQTSSELTAEYKSRIIKGKSMIDLTGGFGVDAYYFAKQFETVTHCEWNEELSAIVKHNFKTLKVGNINTIAEDGLSYLKNSSLDYDWIYVDPSRRHDSKGKVFFLKDCLPNIPEHLDILWSRSKNILIKTSPLLDLTIGLNELEYVKTVQIVAVNNEVKELLWVLEYGFAGKVNIKTVNLKNSGTEQFEFLIEDEAQVEIIYGEPLTYLYEPNSAIMKSGGFNSVAEFFKVKKLHKHSHLYTSDSLVDFPGRAFKILKSIPYNKKQIKKLSINKANITTRNFPDTVQNIRKLFKIKDGGNDYLFFTTDMNNEKTVLICTKVNPLYHL